MPRPSARAAFGVPPLPFQSYFPSIPSQAQLQDQLLRQDPFAATYAAYNPYAIREAQEAGEAQGLIDTFDPENPESITGLQRMVGRGNIKPQQANAIFGMVDRAQREKDRQEALDMRRQMNEAKLNAQAKMDKADRSKLIRDYSDFTREISDEEKQKAFKKQTGADIASDRDWNKAWHLVKDPRKAKFLSDMEAIEQSGGVIPENLQNVRQSLLDEAQAKPVQAAAPAPAQSTEGGQSHVVMPNGKVAFFKTPDEAQAFKAKYGLP